MTNTPATNSTATTNPTATNNTNPTATNNTNPTATALLLEKVDWWAHYHDGTESWEASGRCYPDGIPCDWRGEYIWDDPVGVDPEEHPF